MNASSALRLTLTILAAVVLMAMVPGLQSTRAAGPWYVAPGGNDGNSCISPGAPCATINGAMGKATSGDTIYVAAGTYTGTGISEVVLINRSATLSGGWNNAFTAQSATSIIDGQGGRRGVTVNSNVIAFVEHFTVQNGYASSGGGIHNSGSLTLTGSIIVANSASSDYGGGIFNSGSMTINNTTVSDNVGANGGGIGNYDGALTVNQSTISGNTATNNVDGGGGIAGGSGGSIVLNNSTVSGNHSGAGGGGIRMQWGTLNLNNSTISRNAATGYGGGVYSYGGTVTLQNTIIAENTAAYSPDCTGGYSSGYNLLGSTSGCGFTPGTGDLIDVTADLGPLIGPTGVPKYHPLLPGSPAIDSGNPSGCVGSTGPLITDQRGVIRVGRCDIGAYEYTIPGPATRIQAFGGTPQSAPPFKVYSARFQALVLDAIGSPVTGTMVTFSAPNTGPSGIFSDTGTFTATAVTPGNGIAAAPIYTANGLTGTYTVTAVATGVITPANFVLNNIGWYVTPTGNDNNSCTDKNTPCATINGALNKPSFVAGGTVLVAVGTYTGGITEVVLLNKDATLSGGWNTIFTAQSGMSTVDGQDTRRGVTVDVGVTAVIERLIVKRGNAGGPAYPFGGGIRNRGTLTLNSSAVSNNNGYLGAGIHNAGNLTLNNSTVDGNVTLNGGVFDGYGGGIYNAGNLVLNNSTISTNAASYGSGIENDGILQLSNSTVSNNNGGIRGSGSGLATLRNSIVAGNSGSDCWNTTLDSAGYNLVGYVLSCTFTSSTGDITNTVPGIKPLEGLPGYHPLLPDSLAFNAGNPAGCTDHLGNPIQVDQRGLPRAGRCDIGAYEVMPLEFSTKLVTPDVAALGDELTFTISITNNQPFNVTNVQVTDTLPVALTYVDDSLGATSGNYNFANGIITWTGSISASQVVTIAFEAMISQTAPYSAAIVNTVIINGGGEIFTRTATVNVVSPVDAVVISGPQAGYSGISYLFTATAGPVTATLPITYTWKAAEQSTTTNVLYSLTDLITFTWNTTGTKAVTVTAMNIRDAITSTYAVTIEAPPKIHLPLVFKNRCSPLYADNFSNPASGWPISDDGNIRREYLNGEYRTLVRNEDWTALARPGVQFSDYVLEVDVRNATGIYGSYGLAFGISNAGDQFYTFEIDPNQGYDVWRYNATTGWTLMNSGTSFSINWGTASNHLNVIRNGSQISVYANGQLVATLNNSSYLGSRGVGLVTSSHSQSNVDARFDNFAVYAPQCGVQ